MAVIVPDPVMNVHTPVPVVGRLPERLVVVTLQSDWSVPAAAVVGNASTIMFTSSVLGVQTPLLMVHLNVAVLPMLSPVTPDVAEVLVVTTAVPVIKLHAPVPLVGVFPAKVAVVALHIVWSVPAAAAVGVLASLIITSSVLDVQAPLLIVHLNVVLPPINNAVTPVL